MPQPVKSVLASYPCSVENLRAIAHHRRRFGIDKIIFLCSCAYLLGVAGWIYHVRVGSPEQNLIVQGDAHRQLISYMGRSLQAIEPPQPPQPAQTPQKTLPIPPVKPLPTIAVPVTSSSTPAPPPIPPQPTAATPSPAPPSTPVPTSTPAVPPAAPPTPSTAPALTAKATVTPPPPTPAPAYRLVGLVELGDRSVALININNVTQRVAIGETIGASGWTLEAVTAQSVALNRNGEQRSLYVGQDF